MWPRPHPVGEDLAALPWPTLEERYGNEGLHPVEGVFIPQRAVLQDQQGHYVIALDDNDTLVRRNIEVGIRDGADWSVRSGLEPGERLIVQGAQRLAPGTPVTIGSGP